MLWRVPKILATFGPPEVTQDNWSQKWHVIQINTWATLLHRKEDVPTLGKKIKKNKSPTAIVDQTIMLSSNHNPRMIQMWSFGSETNSKTNNLENFCGFFKSQA